MTAWDLLFDLLLLLSMALLVGTVAERFRQNAIVGYILAGMLIGPNGLALVDTRKEMLDIAELGAALLLFAIGLEFSLTRLRRLGKAVFMAGAGQVLLTGAVVGNLAWGLGRSLNEAIVFGSVIALSSTACVLRIFQDQGRTESSWGRGAIGVLLFQDAAVVPLLLFVSVLQGGGSLLDAVGPFAWTLVKAIGLFGSLALILNIIAPRALNSVVWARNRELPTLLAIVVALGSAWVAHHYGFSPAFGALVAGILLAGSPFAHQIRADTSGLRTPLATFFFTSIGMFGNPAWMMANPLLVIAIALLVISGKTLLAALVLRPALGEWRSAFAGGLSLAQVGEFSFVLAALANASGILSPDSFRLLLSVTVISLLTTPAMISLAGRLALGGSPHPLADDTRDQTIPAGKSLALVIGFGPSARTAIQHLGGALSPWHFHVLERNPAHEENAGKLGAEFIPGDALSGEMLEACGVGEAELVLVTLPDPATAEQVVKLCRERNDGVLIIVRCRQNRAYDRLRAAGADQVVNEEEKVGIALARAVLEPYGNGFYT